MNTSVRRTLEAVKLGKVQTYGQLAVFPIFLDGGEGPRYLTLDRAIAAGSLTVTEISEGGSVPELMVTNRGDLPVLILDGEELIGAKQNRVLNTTVLLAPGSKGVVPVSCTEQGRWSSVSEKFAPSEVVMDRAVRSAKMQSVSRSRRERNSYASDQGAVWDGIATMQIQANVVSETGAMRDVYRQRTLQFNQVVEAFPLQEGQKGLIAFFRGKVEGLDMLSRSEAYAGLHDKLLRSYGMEAILSSERKGEAPKEKDARRFLETITEAPEESYPSVGLGTDVRCQSGRVCGSVLVHEETCIHGAFFPGRGESGHGQSAGSRMSSVHQRRNHRRN